MEVDFEWIEANIFHRSLNKEEKNELSKSITVVEFNKSDVLITEGEPSDALYLLHSGKASVQHNSHGQQVTVGEAGEGAQLGDMAIFDDQLYSTTITARSEGVVYKIPRQELNSLMSEHPDMAKDIMMNTIRRLAGIVRSMNSVNAYSQQYIHGRRL
jgi:CRP-like cAMP-binding protein